MPTSLRQFALRASPSARARQGDGFTTQQPNAAPSLSESQLVQRTLGNRALGAIAPPDPPAGNVQSHALDAKSSDTMHWMNRARRTPVAPLGDARDTFFRSKAPEVDQSSQSTPSLQRTPGAKVALRELPANRISTKRGAGDDKEDDESDNEQSGNEGIVSPYSQFSAAKTGMAQTYSTVAIGGGGNGSSSTPDCDRPFPRLQVEDVKQEKDVGLVDKAPGSANAEGKGNTATGTPPGGSPAFPAVPGAVSHHARAGIGAPGASPMISVPELGGAGDAKNSPVGATSRLPKLQVESGPFAAAASSRFPPPLAAPAAPARVPGQPIAAVAPRMEFPEKLNKNAKYNAEAKDSFNLLLESAFHGLKTLDDVKKLPAVERKERLMRFGWQEKHVVKFEKELASSVMPKVKYVEQQKLTKYKLGLGPTITRGVGGKEYDTARDYSAGGGMGFAIFVMDGKGTFYSAGAKTGLFHHSSFLQGANVAAAGTMKVENGKLIRITNKSGHYFPSVEELRAAVLALQSQGVPLAGVRVNVVNPPTGTFFRATAVEDFLKDPKLAQQLPAQPGAVPDAKSPAPSLTRT